MTELKNIFVYKYVNDRMNNGKKVLDYIGKFHGWGVDYEEFETGPGNYSVAIVERPSTGDINLIYANNVSFQQRTSAPICP